MHIDFVMCKNLCQKNLWTFISNNCKSKIGKNPFHSKFPKICYFQLFNRYRKTKEEIVSLQITFTYSVVYTKTAFGPFRRPDGISESRNSSPLSKSVAPIRLNLVPPKPDCPIANWAYTKHQRWHSSTTTNKRKCFFFTCFNHVFFRCLKRFFQTCQPWFLPPKNYTSNFWDSSIKEIVHQRGMHFNLNFELWLRNACSWGIAFSTSQKSQGDKFQSSVYGWEQFVTTKFICTNETENENWNN